MVPLYALNRLRGVGTKCMAREATQISRLLGIKNMVCCGILLLICSTDRPCSAHLLAVPTCICCTAAGMGCLCCTRYCMVTNIHSMSFACSAHLAVLLLNAECLA